MAMDKFLAEYYGTLDATKTAAAHEEDLEKQASVDMFVKLAKAANIDLTKMAQADVQKLYDNWRAASAAPTGGTTKTAEEEKEEEAKKKREEEAKKEHEEKKAQAEKVAEADFLGRVMAHAFEQEKRNIVKEASAPAAPPARVKTAEEEDKEKKEREEKAKKEHEHGKGGDEHHEEGKHHMPPAFMEHVKGASALDQLAAECAYGLAVEAKIDPKVAFDKVAGVINLGIAKGMSEKVAAAPFEQAVGIRALELLEKAGYEVTWAK
jgi:hypothetical protein